MRSEKKHIVDELEVKIVPQPEEFYFLQLKERILQELPEHPTAKIIPIYKRWYFWSGAAAAVLVLFTLNTFQNVNTQKTNELDFSSVSKEEVLNYLHENIEELEDHELVEHVTIASNWTDSTAHEIIQPATKQTVSEKEEPLFQNIEREEILEYLKNEDISVDELLID